MSTRTITLLFATLILFIATGFILTWYFLFANQGLFNPTSTEQADPFGFGGAIEENLTQETPEEEPAPTEETVDIIPPRLKRLTSTPVVAVVATTTAAGTFARYIDRASGNVYDINLETGEQVRVTNTTNWGIQEAEWFPDGIHFISRGFDQELESVITYLGTIIANPQSATNTPQFRLDGSYLQGGALFATINKTGNNIVYGDQSKGGLALYTALYTGDQKKLIANIPFKEALVDWPRKDTITITTKPSSGTPGYAYLLPSKGGALEKLMEPKYGLQTKLSPDGTLVLFSEAADKQIFTGVYKRKTREQLNISLNAIVEKCIWSAVNSLKVYCGSPRALADAEYPDSWHMGLVSFADYIWEINTTDGTATLLEIPDEITPDGIDMIGLSVSKNDEYLLFINKKDGFLWSYKLN
jgi:hypothetical protein